MKQSRGMSLAESLINIGVGFFISLLAQMIFLPLLGVPISHTQNLLFALIMTAISIARSYLLRRLFEALHIRHPLSAAAIAVLAERRRQIEAEGWSAEHDDKHAQGELAAAGSAYAHGAGLCVRLLAPPAIWPWAHEWWKPRDFRRDLVRAGALILAELERFDRCRKRVGRDDPAFAEMVADGGLMEAADSDARRDGRDRAPAPWRRRLEARA